ncbi:MAG: hypothetical protein ACFFDW_07635, partial [Candidatus Thorarchaeota archaeon]
MISRKLIEKIREEFKEESNRAKDEKNVTTKYSEIFAPDKLDNLSSEDFHSFLCFSNNKHWEGIHRNCNDIIKDMDRLRKALKILLDEDKKIEDRLNLLIPKQGGNYIKYLGKAILTPILLIVYPKKYGVYNTRS